MRKLILAASTVALTLLAIASPAGAKQSPPPLGCGSDGTLTVTATVKLDADLTCDLEVQFLDLKPIEVRLGGHTLTGNIYANGVGIFGGAHGLLTIRHGTVTGNIAKWPNLLVSHAVVANGIGRIGGCCNPTPMSLIVRDSDISGGVENTMGGPWTTVRNSTIRGGLYVGDGDFGGTVTVANNLIVGGDQPGITIWVSFPGSISGTITHNVITGSTNNSFDNGAGITFQYGPSGLFTITHNVIAGNAGHGIYAPPSSALVVGHHNLVTGNGLDPQCVGLVCSP